MSATRAAVNSDSDSDSVIRKRSAEAVARAGDTESGIRVVLGAAAFMGLPVIWELAPPSADREEQSLGEQHLGSRIARSASSSQSRPAPRTPTGGATSTTRPPLPLP